MASVINRRRALAGVVGCLGFVGVLWGVAYARGQGNVVDVTIDGDQYAFSPKRIDVQKDDLVKITFRAGDIAHSFTIDAYRIAKRAAAGQTVVFEFRADQAGTFCVLLQSQPGRQVPPDEGRDRRSIAL